jgi:hypothetical protein
MHWHCVPQPLTFNPVVPNLWTTNNQQKPTPPHPHPGELKGFIPKLADLRSFSASLDPPSRNLIPRAPINIVINYNWKHAE